MKFTSFLCALFFSLLLAPATHAKPAASRVLQKHAAPITALTYSPDGKTLASADEGGRVKLTDVGNGKTKLTFRYKEKVAALAYSPDGKMLAVGRAREVRLLNPQTAAPIRVLKTQKEVGGALNFSANGQRLIVTEGDGQGGAACSVWKIVNGKQLRRHTAKNAEINGAALSPDGKTFVAPDTSVADVALWNVAIGKRVRVLDIPNTKSGGSPYFGTVAFSPDGKFLAGTGSFMEGPGHLTIWNVSTGKIKWGRTFDDYGGALAWSPDSSRLAVGTFYDTTYDDPDNLHRPTGAPIFNARSSQWKQSVQRTPDKINALSFSPDGQTVAVGVGKIVRLWRTAN